MGTMTETKKKYWQEPGWEPLSPRRKYPWRLSDRSEWQDVLSTYECLIGEPEPEATPNLGYDDPKLGKAE